MGKDLTELASYMMPLAAKLLGLAASAGLDPVVEEEQATSIGICR